MRKQLGMLTSFLFLCAMSFAGFGCSDNRCCDNNAPVHETNCQPVCHETCAPNCEPICEPVHFEQMCPPVCRPICQEPCRPVCAPAPCEPVCMPACPPACKPACPPVCKPVCAPEPCKPVCKPKPVCPPEPCCKVLPRCEHPPQSELNCLNYVTVRAANPKMCLLGDQYPLDFTVHACLNVCDVVITTHLPEGVSYVRSEPPAQVDGRKLTWNIGPMRKDECRAARVTLKCECEGPQCVCFCATATPVQFCALLCAKPILTCEKCGPEQVCPGDAVEYSISVSNRGSCTAEEVVVTDNLPPEVEHSSGLRTLNFKLGSIEPCQTKTIKLCTTAVKRGKACNTIVVSSCNADSVSCQWCTCICCCGVELVKNGPKEVPIGKNADYQIVATNTGDLPLTDVVITDNAPNSTSIVAAKGAQVSGNQAVWRIKEMKPGEKAAFNITLTTCVPGCFTNRVALTDCEDCNACAEFTTRWKGRPALNLCAEASENPICVGERTSYNITVINQGSETDTNVVVVVRAPNQLLPVDSSGATQGKISGQVVTFEPIQNLRPRQSVTYRVDFEGKASGDARVSFEVSSDAIKPAVTQQESLIVN